MENQKILGLMISAAEESGEVVRENFRKSSEYEDKTSHIDIVTKTDVESQKNIHEKLVSGMVELGMSEEEIGFIEEESASDSLKKYNFSVDPIDGTTNFASGIPFSCISIGYSVGTDLTLGVVLEPFSQTLYWGEVGSGSFVKNELAGERKLELKEKPMKSWMVAAHLNGLDTVDGQFELYKKIYPEVRGLRNIGSLTLDVCMMADNVFDLVLNKGCYLWDLAAARVILNEAGGELYSFNGNVLEFNWEKTKKKYEVVACSTKSLEQVNNLL